MQPTKQPTVIADDVVVSMDYTLTVDGEVLDTSEDSEPIEFLQGHGNIIPGLERALYGLGIGDSKQVVVAPVDGYGEIDPEDITEVPRDEFPPQIPLEVGIELQLREKSGEVLDARILAVSEDTIRLDFNHPLAGKQLHFSIKVVGLRSPSAEEIDHGHVHQGGHNH